MRFRGCWWIRKGRSLFATWYRRTHCSVSVAELNTLPQAVRALETLVLESGYETEDVDVRVTALDGMTRALDRYQKYWRANNCPDLMRLKGTLVGIGATFSLQKEEMVVTHLVEGAPAQQAGIRKGDVLHRIEGVPR